MSLALPVDSSQRQRASLCWAFSMSIHGLLIGLAVALLTEIPTPPPPSSGTWRSCNLRLLRQNQRRRRPLSRSLRPHLNR